MSTLDVTTIPDDDVDRVAESPVDEADPELAKLIDEVEAARGTLPENARIYLATCARSARVYSYNLLRGSVEFDEETFLDLLLNADAGDLEFLEPNADATSGRWNAKELMSHVPTFPAYCALAGMDTNISLKVARFACNSINRFQSFPTQKKPHLLLVNEVNALPGLVSLLPSEFVRDGKAICDLACWLQSPKVHQDQLEKSFFPICKPKPEWLDDAHAARTSVFEAARTVIPLPIIFDLLINHPHKALNLHSDIPLPIAKKEVTLWFRNKTSLNFKEVLMYILLAKWMQTEAFPNIFLLARSASDNHPPNTSVFSSMPLFRNSHVPVLASMTVNLSDFADKYISLIRSQGNDELKKVAYAQFVPTFASFFDNAKGLRNFDYQAHYRGPDGKYVLDTTRVPLSQASDRFGMPDAMIPAPSFSGLSSPSFFNKPSDDTRPLNPGRSRSASIAFNTPGVRTVRIRTDSPATVSNQAHASSAAPGRSNLRRVSFPLTAPPYPPAQAPVNPAPAHDHHATGDQRPIPRFPALPESVLSKMTPEEVAEYYMRMANAFI